MDELIDKLPFNCIILGPTNSGTERSELRGSYKGIFEYIILVCPTYSKNSPYQGFAHNDPRFIVIQPESSEIDNIDQLLIDIEIVFSGYKTLLILDDLASSSDLKRRSNQFVNLAFSARHSNISVWVLTQHLTSIAKPFRDNVGCIVSFYTPNKQSNQILFDEYGGELDTQHRNLYKEILKTEKYARICFCLRYPFKIYMEIPNSA